MSTKKKRAAKRNGKLGGRPRYRYLRAGEVMSRDTDEVCYCAPRAGKWDAVIGLHGMRVTDADASDRAIRRRMKLLIKKL